MTTQMMKAPPRFETCLFGQSGVPIPIKAYDYETTEIVNIVSDENFHGESGTGDDDDESGGGGGNVEGNNGDIIHNDNVQDDNDKAVENEVGVDETEKGPLDTTNDGDPSIIPTTKNDSHNETPSIVDEIKQTTEESNTLSSQSSSSNISPQTPTKPSNMNKIPTPPSRPEKIITRSNQKQNKQATKSSSSKPNLPPILSSSSTTKKKPQSNNTKSGKNHHTINLQELRRLSSQGVPDECSYRPLAWRILLGYLPLDTTKWQTVLDRDRLLYRTLVKELFVYGDHHDYPFELEGRKLIGRGLNNDGKRSDVIHNHEDKVNTLKNRYGERRNNSIDLGDEKSTGNDDNEGVEVTNDSTINATNNNDDNDNDKDNNKDNDNDNEDEDDNTNDKEEDEVESKAESTICQEDIPNEVKEQWRKSGRDPESLLAGMGKTISGRFVNALLITNNDTASTKSNDIDRNLYLTKSLDGDYDPKWRHFLENASLLDEIRKDVVRTHPDLKFFLEPNDNLGSRRYAAIERILFVWAKLNKGVRYVQGMNEIVGTLYFVLANDENEEWAAEAEADTYFLFNTLMVEMRDIFVPDLDEADTGIQGRMANMISLLSLHDPEVRCHLDDCHIDPGFYSIRWLTTLLSREFLLPDTIRLWDSMFASTHKDNFMRYVCVCMVMVIREDLLKGDFGTCLRLLQAYPPTNVDQLLESSRALWIYESQVTLACHKGGISLTQALSTIAPPPAVLMAYGLQGGVTTEQVGQQARQHMPQLGERRFRNNSRTRNPRSPTNNSPNATAAAAARSILGFLGLNNSPSS